MSNFKTCSNGHNYDASKFAACPFCPANSLNTDFEKTMKEFKKTQLINDVISNQFDKTMINDDSMEMKTFINEGAKSEKHPLSRTTIVTKSENASGALLSQSNKRKIVGWLVTFSHDEFGEDFRLYVGKNKVGSSTNCDIVINDTSISGDHATILFRENEFLIRDLFSTNGSKINGVTMDEGKLKDGDELMLGNTLFIFKTFI